ncbi:MAG: hypothetical protein KJ645_04320 [Planctomycetes bacterium]|nr:hypothetical protein [Planctomycetota bacterium]
MTCREFENYFLELSHEAFATLSAHMITCAACRERFEEQGRLSNLAKSLKEGGLKEKSRSPDLWRRIENALVREKAVSIRARTATAPRRYRKAILVLAAAAAIFLMVVPPLLWLKNSRPESLIMNQAQTVSLHDRQARIEKELERVEPLFRMKIAADERSGGIVSRKIDRLDSNIETCRKRCAQNRMNHGVRKALLGTCMMKLTLIKEFLAP